MKQQLQSQKRFGLKTNAKTDNKFQKLGERYRLYLLEQKLNFPIASCSHFNQSIISSLHAFWDKISKKYIYEVPQFIRGSFSQYQYLIKHLKQSFHETSGKKQPQITKQQKNCERKTARIYKNDSLKNKEYKQSRQKIILEKCKSVFHQHNVQKTLKKQKFTIGFVYARQNMLSLHQILLASLLPKLVQKLKKKINLIQLQSTRNKDWIAKISQLEKQLQSNIISSLNYEQTIHYFRDDKPTEQQLKHNLTRTTSGYVDFASDHRIFELTPLQTRQNRNYGNLLENNEKIMQKQSIFLGSESDKDEFSSMALKIINKQNQIIEKQGWKLNKKEVNHCLSQKLKEEIGVNIPLQTVQTVRTVQTVQKVQTEQTEQTEQTDALPAIQDHSQISDNFNDLEGMSQSVYFQQQTIPKISMPIIVALGRGLYNQLILLEWSSININSFQQYKDTYVQHLATKFSDAYQIQQQHEKQIMRYAVKKQQQHMLAKQFTTQKSLLR